MVSSSSWFQRWNSSTPSIARVGSVSRCSITTSTSAPGIDALGDLAHGVLDAVQLVPPPRVGLVEVELDAVEVLRVHRVALAPDRVVLVGVWRVLLDEEPPERGVRLGGAGRQALEAVAEGAVAVSATRRTRRRG